MTINEKSIISIFKSNKKSHSFSLIVEKAENEKSQFYKKKLIKKNTQTFINTKNQKTDIFNFIFVKKVSNAVQSFKKQKKRERSRKHLVKNSNSLLVKTVKWKNLNKSKNLVLNDFAQKIKKMKWAQAVLFYLDLKFKKHVFDTLTKIFLFNLNIEFL